MASNYQRLNKSATPVVIEGVDGPSWKWAATRDNAAGRAIEAPPADMMYHGKIKGNDPGVSARRSFYRKHGFACMDKPKMHGPRKPRKRKAKIETKPVVVDNRPEQEYTVRLTHADSGGVIEIVNIAVDSKTAIANVQGRWPMYVCEIME